jgi:EmrB/QacA subfamily drug resistance transporter
MERPFFSHAPHVEPICLPDASIVFVRTPCDEAVLRSGAAGAPCPPEAKGWILAATILATSMAFIDSTVVNVALPALQTSFHATVVDVQWVVESYGLFLAALILVGGSLGDMFGRRRVFLAGVAIFAVASEGCGVAPNIRLLIAARSVQGVGAALLVPGSLAIISSSFDQASRGKAIGTWSGFSAITTALGPVLGGWLVEHGSWRWVFFLNLPLAVAVIAISIWRVPESRSDTAGPIDWLGAIFVTFGLGGLVGGLIESVNLGWSNPWVVASLAGGVALLILFVWVEARQKKAPMFPLGLLGSRTFAGANLLTLFLYSAVGIFFFLFPLDLIQVQGYSTTKTGAAILPFILLMFLLSRWSGGLVSRYGARSPLSIGPLIVAAGFVLIALPSIGQSYWTAFFPAIVVLGFGMAVTVAPLTTVVMTSVSQDRAGTASGVNNAVARVAGVLAIAVLGIIMVSAFSSRLNQSLAPLPLSPAVTNELHANVSKLAGLPAPSGVDPQTASTIRRAVGEAFLFGFRITMGICVGLSLASAWIARRMIR